MWLEFDGIVNARDLGGIPAADGRRVRPGRLLRGAGLEALTEADIRKLQAYPLRHIVDLRDARECEKRPDMEVPGAVFHNLPALNYLPPRAPMTNEPPDFMAMFRRVYTKLARSDDTAEVYREFFRILLDCTDGAVYFHCAQGKDRTGIAAILALTALGADQTEAERDYFLSNDGLRESMEHPEKVDVRPWPRETLEQLFLVHRSVLDAYLGAVREDWGGLDGYLRGRLGLTDADFARLRELYLE